MPMNCGAYPFHPVLPAASESQFDRRILSPLECSRSASASQTHSVLGLRALSSNLDRFARFFRIQNVQQMPLQFVNAEKHLAHLALQSFRRALERIVSDFHDVADFVDQQAHGSIRTADDDVHRMHVSGPVGKIQSPSQVQASNNLPAEIHEPADHPGGQGNLGNFQIADDFLNFFKLHSEHELLEIKCAELMSLRHGSANDLHMFL